MSARNRQGNVFDFARAEVANPLEWFRTPSWCVDAIAPHLGKPRTTVDLGCGDGSIGVRLFDLWPDNATIFGIELDEKRADVARASGAFDSVLHIDALSEAASAVSGADLIISNPPYTLAEDFARQALKLVRPGGTVAFLLRLGWLASRSRVAFHREFPSDVYVLPKRPSFTGNGKSDSADYGWFLWSLGRGGHWSALEVPS